MAGGMSEHFFYGTRLLPFVLTGFLAYLLAVHRTRARRFLPGFLLLALGYLIGFQFQAGLLNALACIAVVSA